MWWIAPYVGLATALAIVAASSGGGATG